MRHIIVMSLSASVGLVSLFVVDFVDLYFISLLGDTSLTAAVGFSGTLLFFGMSVTIGLMIAMSALGARRIGAGDLDGAREIATSVMTVGLIIGTVFGALFWVFAPNLLGLLGATGHAQQAATGYLRIIVPSMPIMALAMVSSGLLRAHGDARRAMNVTLSAGIVNAILDPVFIFGLGLGLEGAAWASVCARLTMSLTAMYPIMTKYGGFAAFDMNRFRGHLAAIFAIAGPAILTNLATPAGTAFVTRAISPYGDEAVAGMSVIARLLPLAFCVIFALSGAVGPIVGQNFGAHHYGRVRETIRKSVLFTIIYTVGIWGVLFLSNGFIAEQFNLTGSGRSLVFWFTLLAAPLMFFNGVLFVCNAVLNNLDRPIWSTWLNWGRNTLGIIPFVWIGAKIGEAPGVMIGQYTGGIFFAILAFWISMRLVDSFEKKDTRILEKAQAEVPSDKVTPIQPQPS